MNDLKFRPLKLAELNRMAKESPEQMAKMLIDEYKNRDH